MRIVLLLAALITLAACDSPFAGSQYLPAGSGVDPYENARAQAEEYYQEGLTAESQGHLDQALNDFRQARIWDHDGRPDIKTALNRVEATANRQPPAQPTPTSAASGIAMRSFHSLVYPYSISVPLNWVAKQDETNGQAVDTFIRPAATTLNAVVLISVDPIKSGATLDQLYVATSHALEDEGVSDVQIVDRRVVGEQPAYVMSYRASLESSQASVLHAIVITPGNAWHIILIATPSTTAELVKTFDVMLDSMTFQASAFPAL